MSLKLCLFNPRDIATSITTLPQAEFLNLRILLRYSIINFPISRFLVVGACLFLAGGISRIRSHSESLIRHIWRTYVIIFKEILLLKGMDLTGRFCLVSLSRKQMISRLCIYSVRITPYYAIAFAACFLFGPIEFSYRI